jgi:ubiquinone/menaquinone biosynthesis C-methylase UbiE
MNIQASQSEDNGIALLTDNDREIYSVGISTGGVAEIRMAEGHPERHIVATTIDEEGVAFAQKFIREKHLERQIKAKIEDVSKPLSYEDNHFDYIYARLVLHYLPKAKLDKALAELHRVLKPGGKVFVVVRSVNCPDANHPSATYDPETGLTTCTYVNEETGKTKTSVRYFHSEESIREHVAKAGFTIEYTKSYEEHLFTDFMRTKLAPHDDNVVELVATK